MSKALCNAWKEPYPSRYNVVVKKALSAIRQIEKEVKRKSLPRMNELYLPSAKGQLKRNTELFEEFGWEGNVQFNGISDREYKGLYIFLEKKAGRYKYVYVGISRTVFRRLKQHGWGKKHNEASLAYLIGKKRANHIGKRDKLSKRAFNNSKAYVRSLYVQIFPISEDFGLYFTEVFAAGYWRTKWNTFKTH